MGGQETKSNGVPPWFFVVLVVFMCLGCPAYVAYATWSDNRDKAAMTPVAEAYLEAMVAHDKAAGYQLLCGSRRAKISLENWSAERNMDPRVVGFRIAGARVERPMDAGKIYWVDAELRYANDTKQTISLPMSDERSGWKVCTDRAY